VSDYRELRDHLEEAARLAATLAEWSLRAGIDELLDELGFAEAIHRLEQR
jgi:hypothetical protein